MSPSSETISVVIPVYNAEKTIGLLLERLAAALQCFKGYQIIAVDDDSVDNSFEQITAFAKENRYVTAIRLAENTGQQRAVLCGLRHAQGDVTVIIDDDMQQRPEDILVLYRELQRGYDVVYGIPAEEPSKTRFRKIGSVLRDLLFNAIADKPKHLKVCSFRIMNRTAVNRVIAAQTRFVYISMEIFRSKCRVGNVAVAYSVNQPSRYRPAKLMRLFVNMVIYYAPGRFFKLLQKRGNTCAIAALIEEEKA